VHHIIYKKGKTQTILSLTCIQSNTDLFFLRLAERNYHRNQYLIIEFSKVLMGETAIVYRPQNTFGYQRLGPTSASIVY
jgi:hypothetical protein